MLLYMWTAFATLPSAERLGHSRMMPIPTLQTWALLALRSGLELGALLLLLLPRWPRYFALRMIAAALLLAGWFLATTPLTLSAMHWVHRRWLAAMAVALFGTGVLAGAVGMLRSAGDRT